MTKERFDELREQYHITNDVRELCGESALTFAAWLDIFAPSEREEAIAMVWGNWEKAK